MLSPLLIFMCVALFSCGKLTLFAFSFANLKNGFYLALVRADTNRNTYVDRLIRSYNQFVLLPYYMSEIPTFRTKDSLYLTGRYIGTLFRGIAIERVFY